MQEIIVSVLVLAGTVCGIILKLIDDKKKIVELSSQVKGKFSTLEILAYIQKFTADAESLLDKGVNKKIYVLDRLQQVANDKGFSFDKDYWATTIDIYIEGVKKLISAGKTAYDNITEKE